MYMCACETRRFLHEKIVALGEERDRLPSVQTQPLCLNPTPADV